MSSLFIYMGVFYGQSSSIILARKVPVNYILLLIGSLGYGVFLGYLSVNICYEVLMIFLWGQVSNATCLIGYSFIARKNFSLRMTSFGIITNLILFSFVLCLAFAVVMA